MNDYLAPIRAIHFGAVLWLLGELVFFVTVARPALRSKSLDASVGRKQERRVIRVASGCLIVAIASSAAWLLLEAASMSGEPLAVAINRQTLGAVIGQTLFGRVWLARLAIALSMAVALWRLQTCRLGPAKPLAGATLLAGAYAATVAGTGHAAAHIGADRYLHLSCDAIHILAAGAWAGALPALVAMLTCAGRGERPERLAFAAAATQRFSALGIMCVSALLATGLVNAYYLVGSVAALLGSDYGRLLSWKLLFFGAMIALAADNRLRLTPRLVALSATPASSKKAIARLRRNATLEIVAGVVIVGIVGALGLAMPAAHLLDRGGSRPMPVGEHSH